MIGFKSLIFGLLLAHVAVAELDLSDNVFIKHMISSRAAPFSAPTYLPPVENLVCHGQEVCVHASECSNGYFSSEIGYTKRTCDVNSEVCCTYKPKPTPIPAIPCSSPQFDCVSPDHCVNGEISIRGYSQKVANQCFAPEVCCGIPVEATVLENDGYHVRVPETPFPIAPQPTVHVPLRTPAPTPYTPPRSPAPTVYTPPRSPAPTVYTPPRSPAPTVYTPPRSPAPTAYVPPASPTPTVYLPPASPTPTVYVPPRTPVPSYIPPASPTPTVYVQQPTQQIHVVQPSPVPTPYTPPRTPSVYLPPAAPTQPHVIPPQSPAPAVYVPPRVVVPTPPSRGQDILSYPIPAKQKYLPPVQSGSAELSLPIIKPVPQSCAAALKCTPIDFCTKEGVISKTPVSLTPNQELFRVPLTDCEDAASGVRLGKCCRDPDYVDPWPTNLLLTGQYDPTLFNQN